MSKKLRRVEELRVLLESAASWKLTINSSVLLLAVGLCVWLSSCADRRLLRQDRSPPAVAEKGPVRSGTVLVIVGVLVCYRETIVEAITRLQL
jgi:hypothetical protein